MKIAIASRSMSTDSEVDKQFGKCAYLWIYNDDTGHSEVFENPGRSENCCVGEIILKELKSRNVKRIIAGDFGSNMQQLLNRDQIQMIIYPDSQTTVNQIMGLLSKKKK